MTVFVETHEMAKRYGSTHALQPLSVHVEAGITGLLGPNGAGKTTLLRILATGLAPTSGSLRVLGHDPGTPSGRVAIRRRLGYVPQDLGLFDNFTAFEFVDYVAILKEHTDPRSRHREVRRVLDDVDLGDVRSKKVRKLSGGMRQRLALAQALLGDPSLLVLDEPTVGLDPEQRLRFRQLITRQAERRCVLLSTHLTEDVEAVCDRVVVLHHGAVAFDGTPPQLAAIAQGRVWVDDRSTTTANISWRTSEGRHRHIGTAPAGAELVAPTVHDGYLLLTGAETASLAS